MSLRDSLATIGLTGPVRIPGDLARPRPASVRALLRACRSPRIGEWLVVGRSYGENVEWSEEAQGVASDGIRWYLVSNANDEREGLYVLEMSSMDVVAKLAPPYDPEAYHSGAPCVRNGQVLVPVQGPSRGVWVTDTALSGSRLVVADQLPEPDMFAWCDVNLHNGLVYTANFDNPSRLLAYELTASGLSYRPDSNIPLVPAPDGSTTRVQGACFTPNFKWLAACDVTGFEEIQCFSTISGRLLGRRPMHAETDDTGVSENELESIWYEPFSKAQVHALELDNDDLNSDDMYLWHLALPDVDLL